jgi:hypothetical protein
VPEVLLRYTGLKTGQSASIRNARGEWFPVSPGQRIRLDRKLHPEVEDHLRSGVAVMEEGPPPRKGAWSEVVWVDAPLVLLPPLEHADEDPRVKRLSIRDLKKALRRCVVRDDAATRVRLDNIVELVRAPRGKGGRKPRVDLHPVYNANFDVAWYVAGLIAGRRLAVMKKTHLRPLPTLRTLRAQALRECGLWKGEGRPSRQTVNRHRYRYFDRAQLGEWVLELLSRTKTRSRTTR